MSSKKNNLISKELEGFLESFDWRGFAKAFHEGDIRWHEKEWEEFIGIISHRGAMKEREKIENMVKGLKHPEDCDDGNSGVCGEENAMLDDVIREIGKLK